MCRQAFAVLGIVTLLGCASKLETGYVPRKLGSSAETRRGFYAPEFSAEAKAAKKYEQDFGASGGDQRNRRGY